MLTAGQILGLLGVVEGHLSELGGGVRQQHGDDLHESGASGRSMLPTPPHQFVKFIGTVLRPFHDAPFYDVPEHLVVRETLRGEEDE